MAIPACIMQRYFVVVVALVDIGVVVNQHAGHLAMAMLACLMQRCVVVVVALVDIGVVINQRSYLTGISFLVASINS
jgi:hypothetical protein